MPLSSSRSTSLEYAFKQVLSSSSASTANNSDDQKYNLKHGVIKSILDHQQSLKSKNQERNERENSSSLIDSPQQETKKSSTSNNNNNNDSRHLHSLQKLAHKLTNVSSTILSEDLLTQINKVFDQLVVDLLINKNRDDDENDVKTLVNRIWAHLSDNIVEEISSVLIDSLQVISQQSSTKTGNWFGVVSKEVLCLLFDDDDDGEQTPLSKTLSDENFWSLLSKKISTLIRTIKMMKKSFPGQNIMMFSTSNNNDSNVDYCLVSSMIRRITECLLLRVNYHFHKDKTNANNDDDAKQQQQNNNKKSSSSSSSSAFATRPEHVLQYIGSQYLLLKFVTSKLSLSASSPSSSLLLDNEFNSIILSSYSSDVTKIFESICILPIVSEQIMLLESDGGLGNLKHILGDMKNTFSSSSLNSLFSSSKKKDDDNSNSNTTTDKKKGFKSTNISKDQKTEDERITRQKLKQFSNLKLLHLFNTFSDFATQLNAIEEEYFFYPDEDNEENEGQATGIETSLLSSASFPCFSSLITSSNDFSKDKDDQSNNNKVLIYALINAIRDYSTGSLEASSSSTIENDEKDDVNKVIQQIEVSNEKMTRMSDRFSSSASSSSTSLTSLLLVCSAGANNLSSSNASFFLTSVGQLQCPHYASSCVDLALSLVSQNIGLLQLANNDKSDKQDEKEISLFTKLFMQKILREVILGFFASKLDDDLEYCEDLAERIGRHARNALLLNNDDKETPSMSSISSSLSEKTPSSPTLLLCQFFSALIIKILVPLLRIEETYCEVLPEIFLKENNNDDGIETERRQTLDKILVEPLQTFLQSTQKRIALGVMKSIVTGASIKKIVNNNSDSDDEDDDDSTNDTNNKDEIPPLKLQYETITKNLKLHFEKVLLSTFLNNSVSDTDENSGILSSLLFSASSNYEDNRYKQLERVWYLVFGDSTMPAKLKAMYEKMKQESQEREKEQEEKRLQDEEHQSLLTEKDEYNNDRSNNGNSDNQIGTASSLLQKFASHLEEHHVPNQEIIDDNKQKQQEAEQTDDDETSLLRQNNNNSSMMKPSAEPAGKEEEEDDSAEESLVSTNNKQEVVKPRHHNHQDPEKPLVRNLNNNRVHSLSFMSSQDDVLIKEDSPTKRNNNKKEVDDTFSLNDEVDENKEVEENDSDDDHVKSFSELLQADSQRSSDDQKREESFSLSLKEEKSFTIDEHSTNTTKEKNNNNKIILSPTSPDDSSSTSFGVTKINSLVEMDNEGKKSPKQDNSENNNNNNDNNNNLPQPSSLASSIGRPPSSPSMMTSQERLKSRSLESSSFLSGTPKSPKEPLPSPMAGAGNSSAPLSSSIQQPVAITTTTSTSNKKPLFTPPPPVTTTKTTAAAKKLPIPFPKLTKVALPTPPAAAASSSKKTVIPFPKKTFSVVPKKDNQQVKADDEKNDSKHNDHDDDDDLI